MSHSFNPASPFFDEARSNRFPWLNVALFVATCVSTLLMGAFLTAQFNNTPLETLWQHPSSLSIGLPFSIAVMAILFSHEMGHYLTCRYYGINASLPYFIPFPNLIGTLGAFIRIRSAFRDRGSLLEVGVAGPIAGFIVSVLVLVLSLGRARIAVAGEGQILGEPLIFKLVEYLMHVTPPPGMDSYLHPVSLAAWAGFLVTALNLLPAAQLDGGHIAYALFGSYHRWISRLVVCVLAVLTVFYYWPWVVWIALLLLLKLRHPPTLDDLQPLRRRHIVLGWIALALLVLCFTPAPVSL